jgi:hypothetical protein
MAPAFVWLRRSLDVGYRDRTQKEHRETDFGTCERR